MQERLKARGLALKRLAIIRGCLFLRLNLLDLAAFLAFSLCSFLAFFFYNFISTSIMLKDSIYLFFFA